METPKKNGDEQRGCKIDQCVCDHEYQDAIYGRQQRVHNWAIKKRVWRCTVCGREHS